MVTQFCETPSPTPLTNVKIIRTEDEYESTIKTVETLWGAEQGSPEGDTLDVLLMLVEEYEAKNHAIESPLPIDAIKVRMETLCLKRSDICEEFFISNGVLSEVMNLKRGLSLAMIRFFAERLSLSFECLCQPYVLKK